MERSGSHRKPESTPGLPCGDGNKKETLILQSFPFFLKHGYGGTFCVLKYRLP